MLLPDRLSCKRSQLGMFQHFLRYVRQENWFLLLQRLRCRANPRNLGANSDGGSVRCSIKLEKMQSFSIAVQKI